MNEQKPCGMGWKCLISQQGHAKSTIEIDPFRYYGQESTLDKILALLFPYWSKSEVFVRQKCPHVREMSAICPPVVHEISWVS